MATAAAIFAHHATHAQALTGNAVAPMDSSSGSAGDAGASSSDSATISANDFLTLLVTEMQNQDPTADTDPNEYVDQLVQVNSLEQLISINQTLTGALGTSSSTAGSDAATDKTAAAAPLSQAAATGARPGAMLKAPAIAATPHIPGNLSVPAASAASQRVAHALDGGAHAQSLARRVSKSL